MATRAERAAARWNRLIQIIEAMGFVREHSWDAAFFGSRRGRRTYWTNHQWVGVSSAYITLFDGDTSIQIRMSDHAPKPGGGMRYSPVMDDYQRAGEADVSIHPGSPVTLRNVWRQIEAALERARQESDEDDVPVVEFKTGASIMPAQSTPINPERARERERLKAEKRERERREKERRVAFRKEWQALRATLTPEHWRRWRMLGSGRPGAKALAAELGCRPSVLYAALTNGRKW